MTEASVGDFALLSDCHSAALVGRDGSVDWYCAPRFDSPSVFAHLLDGEGGHWSIRPVGEFDAERAYLEDTMVLRTVFRTPRGRVAVTDALALESGARGHDIGVRAPHVLLRRVEGVEGEVEMALEFVPRPEYALITPLVLPTETGVVARGGPAELQLVAGCPLEVQDTKATAQFTTRAGEAADFALIYRRAADLGDGTLPCPDVGGELTNTREGWRSWSELHGGYQGPYAEQVRRSALVLQALTYGPTGAVVAAATTSLPETCGGGDNWDYRFAWLRDLSLTLRALWIAACPDEAERFFHWIDHAIGGHLVEGRQVQIMYGIEGEHDLTEHSLEHLRGFRGSRPVRVGNDAWYQKQLDVLGEVVDAAYLLRDQLGDEFDDVIARLISGFADKAAESWHETDAGMWEARDEERHYISAKVMCWVALDRAIKLAPRLGEHADTKRWEMAREEVREAILERGWSEEAGAYTGAFGSDQLDASVLLMPLVDFLPATDPRMWATIEAVERELAGDGLVHRWDGDDNGFLICTYWLVECLARAGETERAVELFERTTSYANDLGLLAEEADAATGEQWGNFPQAFSHVGLVNAAWSLSQAREATVGSSPEQDK
ncbi:MAG TPA: glycoside hydrolase family 15 protein [Rubrobacter sp.]|jgi:GH15 family glucan-1,4-alpha-glucosidase|nr:glycoside hydrolase family 15 protein [Rubrobacter sp.]MDQ3376943.1 glycoside hydrolase family 15 protein [Actinomycetota bacterium]HEV8043894.1 glycoside hydrolase family 15 protein [Rubrobacter sp.]